MAVHVEAALDGRDERRGLDAIGGAEQPLQVGQIFGSLVSRVGIVTSEQGALLVRAPAGEAVQVLGLFR